MYWTHTPCWSFPMWEAHSVCWTHPMFQDTGVNLVQGQPQAELQRQLFSFCRFPGGQGYPEWPEADQWEWLWTTDKNPPYLCLPEKASSDSARPELARGFSPARRVSSGVRVVLWRALGPESGGSAQLLCLAATIGIGSTAVESLPSGEQHLGLGYWGCLSLLGAWMELGRKGTMHRESGCVPHVYTWTCTLAHASVDSELVLTSPSRSFRVTDFKYGHQNTEGSGFKRMHFLNYVAYVVVVLSSKCYV